MTDLWSKTQEENFFLEKLKEKVPLTSLFYKTKDERFLAYWEKSAEANSSTVQGRNTRIGKFTEKWAKSLFKPIANKHGYHAISNVICDEIALPIKSEADVAICKTNSKTQKPEDILMIIEVKMSITWNWEYDKENKIIKPIGDYTTHKGTPGLLRSDSVLKAIGKSTKIRFSNKSAYQIPIIILGNTPIKKSYAKEIDAFKRNGIIQGFWSVNPSPLDKQNKEWIKETPEKGFMTFDNYSELEKKCDEVFNSDEVFLHGMLSKKDLGKMIECANNELALEEKARKLLELL